jgi:hypothetical protein
VSQVLSSRIGLVAPISPYLRYLLARMAACRQKNVDQHTTITTITTPIIIAAAGAEEGVGWWSDLLLSRL